MRLLRFRSSRRRQAASRSWTKAVARFRRHFPKLLRTDFWRGGELAAWCGKLLGGKLLEKKRRPKRRRRDRRLAAAWGLRPYVPTFEPLEVRAMLSVSAGSLDRQNFHPNVGFVKTDFNSSVDQAYASAYDSKTGDTIVAGISAGNMAVAAYTASGALDTNFGPSHNGLATFTVGTGISQANAIAIDPTTGDILLAGYATAVTANNTDFAVVRVSDTGTPVSSFGSSGIVTLDIGGSQHADVANAITFAGSNIVVAGQTGAGPQAHIAVAEFNAGTGAIVGGFGSSGVYVVSGPPTDTANAVAVDSSGNIVVAGETLSAQGPELLALNSTGALTARFYSSSGLNLGANANLTSVVVNSNGEYLVAGTADNSFVLAEVKNVSGSLSLDGTFGTAGKTETSFNISNNSTFAQANGVALQSDGKIVLAGYEQDSTHGNDFIALARYTAAGALDTSFNPSGNPAVGSGTAAPGTVTTDLSPANSNASVGDSIVIEPDGKIEVAGFYGATNQDFAIARYVANNAPTAAGNASLNPIDENQYANPSSSPPNPSNPGNTVASLVSRLGESDIDDGAATSSLGIAVVGTVTSNGIWQYSTNGGSSWTAIPTVNPASALLLAQQTGGSNHLIRFVPNSGYVGSASITIRAWDETQGTNGGTYNLNTDASSNLNSGSDNTYTLSITVDTAPTTVYVNSSWAGSAQNASVTDSLSHAHNFNIDAFATISSALTALSINGGTVEIDGGATGFVYNEAVDVTVVNTDLIGFGADAPTISNSSSSVAAVTLAANNDVLTTLNITNATGTAVGIAVGTNHTAGLSGVTVQNSVTGVSIASGAVTVQGGKFSSDTTGMAISAGSAALSGGNTFSGDADRH